MSTQPKTGQMAFTLEFERRIYRVSELNSAIQHIFESDFRSIWVAGEISGCKAAPSGHYYFSLKDSQSQVKCALFKGAARFVRFCPQDGLAVLARGNLDVYEARGEYQLIVELLEPQGAGALQLAFEQLKRRLAEEGLFDPARKRPLPRLPRRIGIVSSSGGAVIRDIIQILERRFPGLHIRLFPAQVQGEGSVEQVSTGLRFFSEGNWADVVIVARGGGSLEDLWTFNEEAVARAIVSSRVPVISAIGHETDFTIADFAADLRAPTPSAAAEMVICTKDSLLEVVSGNQAKALQAMRYRLAIFARALNERGTERAASLMHRAISRRSQRVDDLDSRLRQLQRGLINGQLRLLAELTHRLQVTDLRLRFARNRRAGDLLRERAEKSIQSRLWQARRMLESLDIHLRQLSPLAILSRGYAIAENLRGKAVLSANEVTTGERLRILLHNGELTATVDAISTAHT